MENCTVDALRSHRSTLGLDEEGLERIASCSELEHAPCGTVVHDARQLITSLLLVIRGRLRLMLQKPDGSQQTVRLLSRGDQFGLLALCQDAKFPVTVVADVDSQVLRIPADDALQLTLDLPLWKRRLVESIGGWQSEQFGDLRPRPRFIALVHASSSTQLFTGLILRRLEELGERPTVLADDAAGLVDLEASVRSILDEHRRMLERHEIRRLVAQAKEDSRVIISCRVDRAEQYLETLCHACDCSYWFVEPDQADSAHRRLSELVQGDVELASRMRWVWCIDPEDQVAPAEPDPASTAVRRMQVFMPEPDAQPGRLARNNMTQLVHDMRGVRLGIALSGGAAHGMAHLGVLRRLEEAGIVVDTVSGTSAGAMVGVVYAAGIPPREAAQCFARDLTPSVLERWVPRGELFYLLRKYRGRKWDRMLRGYLQNWQLQQLPTEVSTVAVDLVSGQPFIQHSGDAVRSILDSINLPGLAPPICRDGMALVDGSVLDTLPADIVANQGANYVIAVDVGSQLSPEFAGIGNHVSNKVSAPRRKAPAPSAFATLMRSITVQSKHMQELGAQPADFRIEPDVSGFELSEFRRAVELADAGYAAADNCLHELRTSLRAVDRSLADE